MAKGLDLLLNKIRSEPGPTLISRYLSLVDDIPDGSEKASLVLKLASLLSKSQPDEALRLAYQVYQRDHHQLGALDIMAEAFTAKGRFAKAAVIQLEKEKLERRKVPPSPTPLSEQPVLDAPDGADLRIADLLGVDVEFDLSHQVSFYQEESRVLTQRWPDKDDREDESPSGRDPTAAIRGPVLHSTRLGGEELSKAKNGLPKPTVLGEPAATAIQGEAVGSDRGTTQRPYPSEPAVPAELEDGRKTPPGGLSRRLLRRLMGKEPGDTVLPFPAAPEIKTTDGSRVATPAGEPSGLNRDLPEQLSVGREGFSYPIAAPLAKSPPLWLALGEQLARLRNRLPLRYVDPSAALRIKTLFASHPSGATLPDDFIRALGELDHRLKGSDPVEVLALKWELFQGLWGGAPTGSCADLLKALGLRHATPAFWGLYLDSLIADRRFQATLQDMRITLKNHPHLNWARIVAFRLPIVWQGLNVHGFAWSEDDGVAALIKALTERPKPKITAILGHAFSSRKAGL